MHSSHRKDNFKPAAFPRKVYMTTSQDLFHSVSEQLHWNFKNTLRMDDQYERKITIRNTVHVRFGNRVWLFATRETSVT